MAAVGSEELLRRCPPIPVLDATKAVRLGAVEGDRLGDIAEHVRLIAPGPTAQRPPLRRGVPAPLTYVAGHVHSTKAGDGIGAAGRDRAGPAEIAQRDETCRTPRPSRRAPPVLESRK